MNEANEVLSDPEKRKKYDELGANWRGVRERAARAHPAAVAVRRAVVARAAASAP